MRKILLWLVCNINLGPLAPTVFGFAIGSRPYRVRKEGKDDLEGIRRGMADRIAGRVKPWAEVRNELALEAQDEE